MTRLAERTTRIASSPTMKVTATVDRLRREGVEVIDFGAGEPDFGTPAAINEAAKAAIDQNFSKYTPVGGAAELKRAICDRYRTDYGVSYQENQVITTAGGKQALYNTALTLFNPGDEVITHAPFWPTLTEQVKLADASPVLVPTSAADGFAITSGPILAAVTARTRGIIINSPCNPTGALISEAELTVLAKEASRRGIWLIVDLCYEKLIYDPTPHNLPAVLDRHCRELSVVCGSASKAYAMTGWRCGWSIGPAPVIAAQTALQSHATSNVSSITQKAVIAALTGSQQPVTLMLDEYRRRRDSLHQWLTDDPRIRCAKPAGAFYLFPDLREIMAAAGFADTNALAQALLDESRVAVTPGEAFDAPGFVRISYATSMENLREGSRRVLEFVARHAPQPQAAPR
ncbi:MAG: aminotransferase class I/II-fold pyridoxal phosphate-dependent enzyme [Luteitalea sp.]|nr:aminotransferase class I/II-fold pyridoxal phosphate-dependent enzyme [Luteitalea sp.]